MKYCNTYRKYNFLGMLFGFFTVISCSIDDNLETTLTGMIKETGTNKPIVTALVSVTAIGSSEATKTSVNQDGIYTIRETLQPGEKYSIRVTADGYHDALESEVLTVGVNQRDITLTRIGTCEDTIRNGNEMGIDCGGSCQPCAINSGTCNDDIKNGNETGIDCGGRCPACTTCNNGQQDGNELGIDCGGSCSRVCRPSASNLSLNIEAIKKFRFSWTNTSTSSPVRYFKLYERLNNLSDWQQVGQNFSAETNEFLYMVPLFSRPLAEYYLQSCNDRGCTNSNSVLVADDINNGIGYIKASNTDSGDQFGHAVAISGDGRVLAVGAHFEDSDSTDRQNNAATEADYGAVYIYVNDPIRSWILTDYIKADNPGPGDEFGYSIALDYDGDTLAVGARFEDGRTPQDRADNDVSTDSGAVYVYHKTNDAWSTATYLKPTTIQQNVHFGYSVSLDSSGNILAVGAIGENVNANTNAGAVYIFERVDGSWSLDRNKITVFKAPQHGTEDNITDEFFGTAVSLSADGNKLAVGAPGDDSAAGGINNRINEFNTNSGAVYVFSRANSDQTSWTIDHIKADRPGGNDRFGSSVYLGESLRDKRDAVLIVGASNRSHIPDATSPGSILVSVGAVYIFRQNGISWNQEAYLHPERLVAWDAFGHRVAYSYSPDGERIYISSNLEKSITRGINSRRTGEIVEEFGYAGAVYTYIKSGPDWILESFLKPLYLPEANGPQLGASIATSTSGDVLVVGAPWDNSSSRDIGNDATNENALLSGAVYIF